MSTFTRVFLFNDDKAIKGHIEISGFVCNPSGKNKCKLTYLIQVDPKGNIPKILVEKNMVKDVLKIVKMKKEIENGEDK